MTSAAARETITQALHDHLDGVREALDRAEADQVDQVIAVAAVIWRALDAGRTLMICGNGGSAADAQHIAAEFTGRLRTGFDRPPLAALALTTDTSFLTACGNDFDFADIFVRQVAALGREGDVLLGISTSGGSRNVVMAFEEARRRGIATVALTGEGGPVADLADAAVRIASRRTATVQEALLPLEHMICEIVEEALYGDHRWRQELERADRS